MKKTSKLACLFGLWVLSGLFTIVSLNVTNWANAWIKIDLSNFTNNNSLLQNHKARLKMLYLWEGRDESSAAWMTTSQGGSDTESTLDIFKWLIVEESLNDSEAKWELIVVGWWQKNSITKTDGVKNSGIAWWSGNSIGADNAAIGGGQGNKVTWENGVVAWWSGNVANNGWVVLWWSENIAWENGLAMWQWAKWGNWSFVWNDGTYQWDSVTDAAVIWAKQWVLIWTYTSKDGVDLVVNWPIQIWNPDLDGVGVGWEIRSKNGCLYGFDGENRHLLGGSTTSCKDYQLAKTCHFGRIELQQWDKVEAYSNAFGDCTKEIVTCSDWKLGTADTYYPSCFALTAEPYHLP